MKGDRRGERVRKKRRDTGSRNVDEGFTGKGDLNVWDSRGKRQTAARYKRTQVNSALSNTCTVLCKGAGVLGIVEEWIVIVAH